MSDELARILANDPDAERERRRKFLMAIPETMPLRLNNYTPIPWFATLSGLLRGVASHNFGKSTPEDDLQFPVRNKLAGPE